MTKDTVIIAGGGPVGLITGLGLARAGVPVTIFERYEELPDDPRAATVHPATLELLAEYGMEEDVRKAGLVCPTFQHWDRATGELIAEFDHAVLAGETEFPYVVQCEQFKISRIALALLAKEPLAELRLGAEVTGFTQDASGVDVTVQAGDAEERHRVSWLVGADGGRSTVRKAAGIEFRGFTFPEQFMVLTTPFDFEKHRGFSYRNYLSDPEEWANCFKVAADGPPGLWRIVLPVDPEKGEAELLSDEAVQGKMQKFFPKPDDYEIVHRKLYTVHQRVAETFRKGRVLLAGDASHANNPIGGMGLNGGIQDGANLADKLGRVCAGESEDLLDLYDKQRRTIATDFVQRQTIENKKRLESRDEATRQENFRELRAIAADPERARVFVRRAAMLEAQRRAAATVL
ncbi:FAD-dependent monooxygenase [Roseibacterium sp. SDUM158016]|uniref:FAD-dependent oxidoreductase n=1 Tax=Roseicyclus sediminis TaxID=2980997 RepID=UPI0021D3EBFA|nr:FAD-dependent monooxygenase [Roseibacterium sp. SDUM158016]MCU4652048.1 FAD-dependent monooxygenase [Roseibacterium sp. SDUM158016]